MGQIIKILRRDLWRKLEVDVKVIHNTVAKTEQTNEGTVHDRMLIKKEEMKKF